MTIELRWDGKYDKDGRRVAPVKIALPFQTVETVNESAQVRAHNLDLWSQGQQTDWRNRLIWGDKKYVLPSLLPEFAGKVNLIYIDPPFATGSDFSFTTTIPESDESFTKEPGMVEQKAYRDTWGRGLDSYLQWFYETAVLLRELLADEGSLYVHLDSTMAHYAKVILDEVFGAQSFINDITWKRTTAHGDARQGARHYDIVDDTILFYCRDIDLYTWGTQYIPFSDEQIKQQYNKLDGDRSYRLVTPTAKKPGGDTSYEWKGVRPPQGRFWAYSKAKMQEMDEAGKLYYSNTGQPYIKYYLDERPGVAASTMWTDIMLSPTSLERVGYPTQKPEALLERIINASSNEGDLVLDCFCGSGTTAAVAEKLGRRWITCDLGRFAIHTTRKRLLSIPGVKPFMVQNLGKYERQAWQDAEFARGDEKQSPHKQLAYRRFMLDLYRARPIEGYNWLHGVRDGRLVHIGGVDAPISDGDVRAIVKEFWSASGQAGSNGVDILGWDFAFQVNEIDKQFAAENNVNLRFRSIPREVLEKRAVEQGDIKFFELGALGAKVSQRASDMASAEERTHGKYATVTLTDFLAPYNDVPDEIVAKITRWSQWIDYWAVDWDYQGDAFHNMAQSYRTRKDPQLKLSLSHTYEQPGTYTVVIKVIDILGNDTTKTIAIGVSG